MTLAEKLKQEGCQTSKPLREKVLEIVEQEFKKYPKLTQIGWYLSRANGMTPTTSTMPDGARYEVIDILRSEGFATRIQYGTTRCDVLYVSIE